MSILWTIEDILETIALWWLFLLGLIAGTCIVVCLCAVSVSLVNSLIIGGSIL